MPETDAAAPRAVPSLRDRWFLLLAAVALLAICTVGVVAWRRQLAAKAAAVAAKAAPIPGQVLAGAEVSFSGLVQARNVLAIPAPMDGTVEAVEVEVGASVEQEQPLARLKNEGLAAALAAAKADFEKAAERVSALESALISARLEASRSGVDAERARGDADRAERNLKREELLFREGATARLKFEKAQKDAAATAAEAEALRTSAGQAGEKIAKVTTDLETAKRGVDEKAANLEDSQAEINAAVVTAPVDGVIVAVNAKAGDEVTSKGADLFQIAVAAGELLVKVEPTPQVAEKFKDGLPALIQLLEISAEGIPGELKRGEKGDWRVEFKAPNSNVKPGLNAVVKVKLP